MTYLSDELYKKVTGSVPIVCVDLVPIRKVDNTWQIGVITRATGSESGKLALIGGRVQYGESFGEAIKRHLKSDLNISKFTYANCSEVKPFYVQQYWRGNKAVFPYGYDPSKHAVGLTYLIEFNEEPQAANEAQDFVWLSQEQVPASAAYNHHFLMELAFKELASLS